MNGGSFRNSGGIAIDAQRLTVDGAMYCRSGFTVDGEFRLFGARIGGQFNLDEATLNCPGGRALFASQLKVENSMFCRHGFTADGEVVLDGARIGGRLDLKEGHLTNPCARTLSADRLKVGQTMFCRRGFTSAGEMRLVDAEISGRLNFDGAELINEGGYVLDAGGLSVAHDATFIDGFTAQGELHLLDASIGGRLDFEGAGLARGGERALNLEGVSASALFLLPRSTPEGLIDLTNVRVGSFYDDPGTWPRGLRLRGFTYDVLGNSAVKVRDRLNWLGRYVVRGQGIASALLTGCARLCDQLGYHLLYGSFAVGSVLETFYSDRGFEVLPVGESVSLDIVVGQPIRLGTQHTEQLFARWRF